MKSVDSHTTCKYLKEIKTKTLKCGLGCASSFTEREFFAIFDKNISLTQIISTSFLRYLDSGLDGPPRPHFNVFGKFSNVQRERVVSIQKYNFGKSSLH